MRELVFAVSCLLSAAQIVGLFGLCYYYFLLVAAFPRRAANGSPEAQPHTTFALAVPAHNEASVIGQTVAHLRRLDYPAELYDVWVVADYCDDDTAAIARAQGAVVHERRDGQRGRKAFALRALLDRILESERKYDAIVVFDADSRPVPTFLAAVAQAYNRRHTVLQGQHVIRDDEGGTLFAALAAVDMRLNNLLRNRAKANLGLTCRLMGDAMCFPTTVLRDHSWPTDSLSEDRELGLYLLTRGVRSVYVPDAISFGQAAPSWRDASAQRLRWYGGAAEIRRSYTLPLLRRFAGQRDWAALDQAIEQVLPPLSLLAVVAFGVAGVHVLVPTVRPVLPAWASVAMAGAWVVLPFIGLAIDGAAARCYGALLLAPAYIVWRLAVGLASALLGKRVRWVRTRRREEIHQTEASSEVPGGQPQ